MEFRSNKKGKPYPIKGAKERDLENNKLGLDAQKTDELVDRITEIAMAERRKQILRNPRLGVPRRMREDPTTPLIFEVPFGPDTVSIENLEHGNPKNYDHPSHTMSQFDEFERQQNNLPKDKQFPKLKEITGDELHDFRVIPHGGISIPAEQERKSRPLEKRDYEFGKLKARSNRTHQRDEDAKEIALDILNGEKPSRFVNRVTKKIRPPKPVRSDFASIITAENGFKGVVKKETIFIVGEHNKPEYVEVTPLTKVEKL